MPCRCGVIQSLVRRCKRARAPFVVGSDRAGEEGGEGGETPVQHYLVHRKTEGDLNEVVGGGGEGAGAGADAEQKRGGLVFVT